MLTHKQSAVAIIVLHFGDKENTLECLKSISKIKSTQNIKVFVIDNGTNTLKEENIRKILPKFELISNRSNLGFAAGNNIGIKRALETDIEFIIFLNNDIVVYADILEKLITPFYMDKKIGITGGVIAYFNNPKKIWFCGGKLNKTFCFTRHPKMNRFIDKKLKEGVVDFVSGAVMMVKREVFKKIGYFNKDYFLYWEDVDFCIRAQNNGYKSYVVNRLIAKHKVSATSGIKGTNKLSATRAYYYARNPFIFMKRNNFNMLGGIFGQIFIRLPYYSIKDISVLKNYLNGLRDGLSKII